MVAILQLHTASFGTGLQNTKRVRTALEGASLSATEDWAANQPPQGNPDGLRFTLFSTRLMPSPSIFSEKPNVKYKS